MHTDFAVRRFTEDLFVFIKLWKHLNVHRWGMIEKMMVHPVEEEYMAILQSGVEDTE